MTIFLFFILYNDNGGDMKVYIEFIFILNLWIDFLLLLSLTLVLKKKTSLKKIIFASTLGSSLSFIFLLKISTNISLLYKFIVSIIMIIISFNFNDLKTFIQDVIYFYLLSIILAGFVYLVRENITIDTFISNFMVLLVVSPLVLYSYIKVAKKEKDIYNKLCSVTFIYNKKKYNFTGFIDTGNRLYDQYKHRPVILLHSNKIKFSYEKGILVPYETASGESIIKCFIPEKLVIDNKFYENILIGLSNKKFNIDGVDMILHSDIKGG